MGGTVTSLVEMIFLVELAKNARDMEVNQSLLLICQENAHDKQKKKYDYI